MLPFVIGVIAPVRSRRGRKLRELLARTHKRRAFYDSKMYHNSLRQGYYAHFITKKCNSEDAKVSIIVPCYNTPAKYFEPLLASLFAQNYQNWELVLVDASSEPRNSKYLSTKKDSDTRIKYIKTSNEGIAANTNKGIAEASGDFIAFLDHDDTLDPNALAECMEVFAKEGSIGLVYSDEDKISDDGERYFEPHFKPDFSLDMLRNVNYITHFVVAKKSVVDKLSGIRKGFDGAQDFDFLLRVVDNGVRIGHVPKILYHWRQADGSTAADFSNKQYITRAGCRALDDHFKRRNIDNVKAYAIKNRPGFYGAHYKPGRHPMRIFLNFESENLLPIEKQFILGRYQQNTDVKKYNIEVIEGKPTALDSYDMVVNGTFIPANNKTDMISLFVLAQESGVAGVSPKIVRHGRIFDMGIVHINDQNKHLFRGLNPDRPLCFGSVEWVRDVDELTGNVIVLNKDNTKKDGRFIIWSHSEFIAFDSTAYPKPQHRHPSFYNENLIAWHEIAEHSDDYITDLVKVKK